MAIVEVTDTFHLSGFDSEISDIKNSSDLDNMIGDNSSSTNYAQFGVVNGSNAYTHVYLLFDTSAVPSDAEISAVTCKIKLGATGSANYIKNRQVRGYNRETSTTIGYSTTVSTTATVYTVDLGSAAWTYEKLEGFCLRLQAQRTTYNTSTAYYLRVYGADLTVTYSYDNAAGDTMYVKSGGVWVPASKVYKKVSGSWVLQTDLTQVFDSGTNYKVSS